ncbi:hypothetical protein [Acerihabitans arboris]|nr:hypothetical protein [Acerihabitans arboris]
MNPHEQKIFLATLVAAFRSTHRYMKRNYPPGQGKGHRRER